MMQVPVVDDLDVVVGMMRGITFNMFLSYAVVFVAAALWWRSRPRCLLCGNRVRIGTGTFRYNREEKKEYTHLKCEELAAINERIHHEAAAV